MLGKYAITNLTLESVLSSLKLALIAALSFCTTARSSAIVLAARTLRMNCFTEHGQCQLGIPLQPSYMSSWPKKHFSS
jgi:hypothetical protein